jgi:hypothetical protein
MRAEPLVPADQTRSGSIMSRSFGLSVFAVIIGRTDTEKGGRDVCPLRKGG